MTKLLHLFVQSFIEVIVEHVILLEKLFKRFHLIFT